MKQQTINHEILFVTKTSFAKRELCEGYDGDPNETKKSSANQLERECWSELVFEMLPGIITGSDQKNNYIYKVNQSEQFIHIALGSVPGSLDYETSIDPYLILWLAVYNN